VKNGNYEFPDELYYDREHSWARIEGDTATVGLSDLGQALANEIVYVEPPRVGRQVTLGQPFMSLESGKWVGRVKAVVSGEIVEANEELEWETTTVNESPYGEGWLVKIRMSNPDEVSTLNQASDADYVEFIEAERKKYDK
jgi:glycine cleavage system H protein